MGSGFQQWAEPWSQLGLWLSLWDEHGDCVEQSGSAGAFWHLLTHQLEPCRERIGEVSRSALKGGAIATELDPRSGVIVTGAPVMQRRRVVGAVVACGLSHEFSDQEVRARFCGRHDLDEPTVARISAGVSRHAVEDLHAYADILHQHVQSLSANTAARSDVESLASRLAQAYEQLSLIYRVSADMTVSKHPVAFFQKLCAETLPATVAERFATILEPPGRAASPPTIVTTGPLHTDPDGLLRLYEQARRHQPNAGPALVVNDVRGEAGFGESADWVQRVIYVELAKRGQCFGGLLALDQRDDEDFVSEDVQLISAMAERGSAFLENARLYDDLEQLFMGTLHALVSSIDAKDPYTCGHSQRVAWLSRHIARRAAVPDAKCERIYLGGLLHDIGKIGVPEAVLCKTGRLNEKEYGEMKRHPEIGARILESVRQVEDLIPGVLHHHERMDGKGYPSGLAGHDVPFVGRVIGLADSVDAMTTNRTYRAARPVEWVREEVRRCAGGQFDPGLADLLLQDDLKSLCRNMARSGLSGVRYPAGPAVGNDHEDPNQRTG